MSAQDRIPALAEAPEVRARPVPADRQTRILAGLAALAGLIVLAVAVRLTPDPRGFGTHRQLGVQPCGMLVTTGLPCPTCGMTTAFSYMVRGRLIRAFMSQPAGLALGLSTIVGVVIGLRLALVGRGPRLDRFGITPFRLFLALLILLVAGWGFKLLTGILSGALPAHGSDVWSSAG